jgi:hypothetical protein
VGEDVARIIGEHFAGPALAPSQLAGPFRALNATFVAKKVFAERDLLPVTTPA